MTGPTSVHVVFVAQPFAFVEVVLCRSIGPHFCRGSRAAWCVRGTQTQNKHPFVCEMSFVFLDGPLDRVWVRAAKQGTCIGP